MQINAIRNFSYGQSLKAHKAVEAPQPEQKPVENQGTTASIYFGKKEDNNAKSLRNAAMAGLGSLMLLTTAPPNTESEGNKQRIEDTKVYYTLFRNLGE